jgi:radical SAM-linked protein
MAYSSGYSPHPRISYANAAPNRAASEAEYLEIGLAAICDPDEVRNALDAALPPGLDIVEVIVSPPGALADQLTGSHWQVDLPRPVRNCTECCRRGVLDAGGRIRAADDQDWAARIRRTRCGDRS